MSDFVHRAVMMKEVLAALAVRPGGWYADGTLGGGGHAAALLEASAPHGRLFGCDRDGAAIEAAGRRLREFAGRFELRQGNFADLPTWVPAGSLDGVLLDLGVSSPQIDEAARGFSFQADGPLDMRMDRAQTLTAATVVNETDAEALARIFWDLGGERAGRQLARAIVRRREERSFATTGDLAALVERVAPRHGGRAHPATKVFQALRIAVNDEIGSLEKGLTGALRVLKPTGRLVVVTFHSLEDRVVKAFGRAGARDYTVAGEVDIPELREPRKPQLRWITRKAMKPSAAEVAENPRSRSAQVRVMEKL
jgi:16S rRNA (cytosine1402-N4)-methyltransferase